MSTKHSLYAPKQSKEALLGLTCENPMWVYSRAFKTLPNTFIFTKSFIRAAYVLVLMLKY